jgi:hypothetical protein
MRSARPRSIVEDERFFDYAEYQPYRQLKPARHDPFWIGIGILALCAIGAFVYVGWFQWR